jgi:hypothetical protein
MNTKRALVLDANILIRAVFGSRVLAIMESYEDEVTSCSPDACFEDARRYIPAIAKFRGDDIAGGIALLDRIASIVETIDRNVYEVHENPARARISARPQRLADRGYRPAAECANLDRRSRLFRRGNCHADHRPCRNLPPQFTVRLAALDSHNFTVGAHAL